MPRKVRLDPPGGRHHVMNRGARRAPVFGDEGACLAFLAALAQLPARFQVGVHGYVLMPNHYHLLLSSPRGNLSAAMRHLGATFTAAVNRARVGWDGPVFRGRFTNRLVEDDAYWMHLLAYLHLNPVRAHLVAKPEQYRWSSHDAYVGRAGAPPWLTTDEHLAMYGTIDAYRGHLRDLLQRKDVAPDDFDEDDVIAPVHTGRLPGTPPPRGVIPVEQALADVIAVTGVGRRALGVEQRTSRHARWVAAWWLTRAAGLTQREVGERLNAHPTLVSRWVGAVGKASTGDLAAWSNALLARQE